MVRVVVTGIWTMIRRLRGIANDKRSQSRDSIFHTVLDNGRVDIHYDQPGYG